MERHGIPHRPGSLPVTGSDSALANTPSTATISSRGSTHKGHVQDRYVTVANRQNPLPTTEAQQRAEATQQHRYVSRVTSMAYSRYCVYTVAHSDLHMSPTSARARGLASGLQPHAPLRSHTWALCSKACSATTPQEAPPSG